MIYQYMQMLKDGESPRVGVFRRDDVVNSKKFNLSTTEMDGFVDAGNAIYVTVNKVNTEIKKKNVEVKSNG